MGDVLEVSPFDDCTYDQFVLPNGLEVVLVHDVESEQSGACMCVKAGALLDPFPGVAHLLEHMLFVSSVKYPELHSYQDYVSRHSGMTNAFTGNERTTYYFQIPNSNFEEAFDRFAQFFSGPSFVDTAVEREIKAVNSENTKNLLSDRWRMMQLVRSSASPESSFHHFATGNEETLWTLPKAQGVDIVQVIKDFHSRYYSPNVMKLAVVSATPLAEMRTTVEKLFSGILNKEIQIPAPGSEPWGPQHVGNMFLVAPTATSHTLRLNWGLRESEEDYIYGASQYLAHCFGHESDGSILAELKRLGWANQLSAGQFESLSSFVVFGIEVELTDEGFEHVSDIIALVFEYIANLKKAGIDKALFDEIAALSRQAFLFAEKHEPSEYAMSIAANMAGSRKRKHYLYGNALETFDPERISRLLLDLSVERLNVFLQSPKNAGVCTQREKWYQTPYEMRPLDSGLVVRCRSVLLGQTESRASLHKPATNPFMATDFSLVPLSDSPSLYPELLCNDRYCQVWWKRDDVFRKPLAEILLEVRSPIAYCSPRNAVLTGLFCTMLDDSLKPLSYHAELASLSFKLINTDNGIFITIHGFSHKLLTLLIRVLDTLERAASLFVWERFPAIREALMRRYANFDLSTDAFKRAQYYETLPTHSPRWAQEEYLEALHYVDEQALRAFIPQLLSQVYFRALLCGNIHSPWKCVDRIRHTLFGAKDGVGPASRLMSSSTRRMVKLPKGKTVFDRAAGSPADANNALRLTFQIGADSIALSCVLDAFNALVANPLFADLRGHKQLGYVVASFTRRELGVLSWAVLCQTDRRIELAESMVANFVATDVSRLLDELTEAQLHEMVGSLIAVARQPNKSISEEALEIWGAIDDHSLFFARRAAVANHLESGAVTVQALRDFYGTYIAPKAPSRRFLCVRVHAGVESTPTSALGVVEKSQPPPVIPEHDVQIHEIQNLAEFRRTRPLYPGPACSTHIAHL